MTCCGQKVSTPFCPLCGGRARNSHPLDSLLQFLRSTAQGQRSKAETGRKENWPKMVQSAEKAAEKWEKWADDLETLIRQEEKQ